MANAATHADFVSMVSQELSCGIERALNYWLGRIELEVVDRSLSSEERLYAIKQILREYKDSIGDVQLGCASA